MIRVAAALLMLLISGAAEARGLNQRGYPGATTAAPQSTFYIATTGNDGNSGTIGSPFLTIGKAQTAAQTALTGGLCPTLIFRGGTYPLASTLSLGSADSGSSSCTVTWESYPSEQAIWSGGTDISGTWSLCTTADPVCNSGAGGVYQSSATPTQFREFYLNGTHRTRARSASAVPSGWTETAGGWTLSGATPNPTSSWKNPTHIEVILAGGFAQTAWLPGWQQIRCTMSSVSGSTITMATPCWNNVRTWSNGSHGAATTPWWIENAYELLPTCGGGCWYYDYVASTVYYIPQAGENMATATTYVPQLTKLVAGNAAHHIKFSHLTFEGATWLPDTGGDDYVSIWAGYYCTGTQTCAYSCTGAGNCVSGLSSVMDAALRFSGASHDITFDHNLFTHNGATSLFFEHGSQHVTVTANKFTDNGAGGFRWGEGSDYAQTNAALQTSNLLFKDNLFSDVAFEWLDTYPAIAVNTTNATFDHNEIDASGEVSISVGFGWSIPGQSSNYGANNTVSNNWTKSPCLYFFDCSGVYIAGGTQPGTVFSGNYVQNAANTTMQACMYPDDGTTGSTWSGNVCNPGTGLNPTGGAARWTFLWTSQVTSNTLSGNFTTTPTNAYVDADTNTITGTVQYTAGCSPNSGTCPLNAINNAGISSGVTPGP